MKGKLIVIEGTDCSGKETQSNLLLERLQKENVRVFKTSYPNYDSPTGKIVGGAYLGKPDINPSYFKEGATVVDSLVASCFYAADRRYNSNMIKEHLEKGYTVIVDRYVESNMAHQGAKLETTEEKVKLFEKLKTLEYGLMELPKPDCVILLYMPIKEASILKKNRGENLDEHEKDENHLLNAEKTYLELAKLYDFKKIDCAQNGSIKTIDNIHEEVYDIIKSIN